MDNTGNINVYICAYPTDTRSAESSGRSLCHLAYRIGRDGHLYRSGLGITVRGGLLGISDIGLADGSEYVDELPRELKRECGIRGFDGVFCDFEGGADEFRTRFAYDAGIYFSEQRLKFYVPEKLAAAAPQAIILISSAVVGSSCDEVYRRAVLRYGEERTALVYEPLCTDFVMPAPTGERKLLTRSELRALMQREGAVGYLSQELCARYFTYRDENGRSHFVLFDDTRTMQRKLLIAGKCGFREAFVSWPDYNEYFGEPSES